ncbi:hypothetical protein HHL11_05540 [Ramlibacter sp. G-1-2-2]|uniref:Uncharacterized protein n=1 Tax=Ramlibacter agri TaxID=2728837 RepID=A0A848GXX6_9BURK|nr:hypothetical protein [Ramlibacter agri]NML43204.1 hypothetical protein [Ramlibacter agri]
MHLSASELARVEAMMERGQVSSEPASPCRTSRMLDALQARSAPPPAQRQPAGARPPRSTADWLDLPSLPELLEARRTLLAADGSAG